MITAFENSKAQAEQLVDWYIKNRQFTLEEALAMARLVYLAHSTNLHEEDRAEREVINAGLLQSAKNVEAKLR